MVRILYSGYALFSRPIPLCTGQLEILRLDPPARSEIEEGTWRQSVKVRECVHDHRCLAEFLSEFRDSAHQQGTDSCPSVFRQDHCASKPSDPVAIIVGNNPCDPKDVMVTFCQEPFRTSRPILSQRLQDDCWPAFSSVLQSQNGLSDRTKISPA